MKEQYLRELNLRELNALFLVAIRGYIREKGVAHANFTFGVQPSVAEKLEQLSDERVMELCNGLDGSLFRPVFSDSFNFWGQAGEQKQEDIDWVKLTSLRQLLGPASAAN